MKNMTLPTASQLTLLSRWMTEGPTALDSDPSLPLSVRRRRRDNTLETIRHLAERTGQMAEYRRQGSGHEHRGEPLSAWMGERLMHGMYVACRRPGYILRNGAGVPPLTTGQMHLISLVAQGHTTQAVGRLMGTTRDSVSSVLCRARETAGCASTLHLVAIAYQNEWLPTDAELRSLSPGTARLRTGGFPR